MDKLAYSLTETAQVLGVSRPTVYALIKKQGFPVFQIGGRKLVSVEGLKNWIRDQTEVTA
ncbi:MAG: helix-turn-helix domain-containing protein [Peptoniphilaceae bacterium]|nr:helix-turn-helix domain-containing protein [Peptoniphilaceae bacterium]